MIPDFSFHVVICVAESHLHTKYGTLAKMPYCTCECRYEMESQIGYVTAAETLEVPPLASTCYCPSTHFQNLKIK